MNHLHPTTRVEPQTYSVLQAAQAIGVGLTSTNAFIKSGRLIARKAGRRTVILRPDLEAFLQSLPKVES